MSHFRIAARTLFAFAILAQLAAPVLAANAKALNLNCPSHVLQATGHAEHAAHSSHLGDHSDHAIHSVLADESTDESHAAKFLDLSCCSVHLTGVMPDVTEPLSRIATKPEAHFFSMDTSVSPAGIDPPPRLFS